MKVLIVGGGFAACYLANKLIDDHPVAILSKESYFPYNRIYICDLIKETPLENITFELDDHVDVRLHQEVLSIDKEKKEVYSADQVYSYDILIIATGSHLENFLTSPLSPMPPLFVV